MSEHPDPRHPNAAGAGDPPSGRAWVGAFAAALGVDPPTDAEVEELLSLAGTAAHSSERLAAPLACWLVARAGRTPAEAHEIARGIAP